MSKPKLPKIRLKLGPRPDNSTAENPAEREPDPIETLDNSTSEKPRKRTTRHQPVEGNIPEQSGTPSPDSTSLQKQQTQNITSSEALKENITPAQQKPKKTKPKKTRTNDKADRVTAVPPASQTSAIQDNAVVAQAADVSTKTKSNDEASESDGEDKTHWAHEDMLALLEFLVSKKSESGNFSNFTLPIFKEAAIVVNTARPDSFPKTGEGCKSKWFNYFRRYWQAIQDIVSQNI
ncbi:hypothetical protein K435DRAFT_856314 [Dendrothele bispora CBS 962.96]|uniref:Uncharacterized protein n=1 Tax=Dendrothele bispora (strain CBS 962.96) TaxID=1314807 RepID=A0A4V4HGG7_DENBC|nr:hypothetical protein K435DRAFT_856314 [Dendrothele bispora CBS 962.96]